MALSFEDFEQLQPPNNCENLGVPKGLVEDLFMRKLLTFRHSTIGEISSGIGLSRPVGVEISESLRDKKLLEYQGAEGRDYKITLTELGYKTTAERMLTGRHVSYVPVAMKQYQTLVELQKAELNIDRDKIKNAFSDLVIEDSLMDQIGPAVANEGAVLMYGPPGTGKTSISEMLAELYDDYIAVPRMVENEGQLIAVYDPAIHHAVDEQPDYLDPRFVLCRRPLLIVGGELELSSLDLQYDKLSGISTAPIQMLANNGILVIDDFGRQTFVPDQLLNRWIMPLAQGVDFLNSNSGNKITIPFEIKLIFSTNIEPNKLGDDAFLRRLPSKVYVGGCTKRTFEWILTNAAEKYNVELTDDSIERVCQISLDHINEYRPYIANDLCSMAQNVAAYDKCDPILDEKLLARVCRLYFVKEHNDSPQADSNSTSDSDLDEYENNMNEPLVPTYSSERRKYI